MPVGDGRWCYGRQWFPERGESVADLTPERCVDLIRTAVGVPDLPVQVLPLTVLGVGHELAEGPSGYGLGSDGAVLVRPDGHVAWRAATSARAADRLQAALDLALARPAAGGVRAA